MKVLVATDSFKGSLTSLEAGMAIKKGILNSDNKNEVFVSSLADGGEGTLETILSSNKSKIIKLKINGPLRSKIESTYGILLNSNTAVIEISKACGITLLSKDKLNPLFTTTYGVGELIKDAIKRGCRHFIVAIGGSSTNDGGVGMLQALGYQFLNKHDKEIELGAIGLKELKNIKIDKRIKELDKCKFIIASDVNNPLCGANGCSMIFGAQKGANKISILKMDKWLKNYARISEKVFKKKTMNIKGSGAAGGLGFALVTFLGGKIESGFDVVIKNNRLEDKIKNVDIIVTGEGKIDDQTFMNKAPFCVAKLAKKYNKKVIAFAGLVESNSDVLYKNGFDACYSILNKNISLKKAMKKTVAIDNLTKKSEQVFNLIKNSKNKII